MCTDTYTNYFYILQCFDPLSINFSPPFRTVNCIYTVLFHSKHRLLIYTACKPCCMCWYSAHISLYDSPLYVQYVFLSFFLLFCICMFIHPQLNYACFNDIMRLYILYVHLHSFYTSTDDCLLLDASQVHYSTINNMHSCYPYFTQF